MPINIMNTGYRHASRDVLARLDATTGVVDMDDYYLRQWSRFEAPDGKYEWMSRHVCWRTRARRSRSWRSGSRG